MGKTEPRMTKISTSNFNSIADSSIATDNNDCIVIDTSDFNLERRMVDSNQETVIYNDPPLAIETEWNAFMKMTLEKNETEKANFTRRQKFIDLLITAKVEAETFATTLSLEDRGILRRYSISEEVKSEACLKEKIREELLGMLGRAKNKIRRMLEKEREDYDVIKKVNLPVELADGRLFFYSNNGNSNVDGAEIGLERIEFGNLEQYSSYRPSGIVCRVRYQDMTLEGSVKYEYPNRYEEIIGYLKEKRLIQVFELSGIRIEITNSISNIETNTSTSSIDAAEEMMEGKEDSSNELCKTIIRDLYSGKSISEMFPKIIEGLIFYLIFKLAPMNEVPGSANNSTGNINSGYHAGNAGSVNDGSYVGRRMEIIENTFGRNKDHEQLVIRTNKGIFKVCKDEISLDVYFNGHRLHFSN